MISDLNIASQQYSKEKTRADRMAKKEALKDGVMHICIIVLLVMQICIMVNV